jgi:hypothetical protein
VHEACALVLVESWHHSLHIQVVKKQQETDEKALQLVQAMVEVYSFVEDVDFLTSKIKPLEYVVQEIIRQTVECAIFIREYVMHGFSGT